MPTGELGGGRVKLAFAEGLAHRLATTTLAVPYGTTTGVAAVQQTEGVWDAGPGGVVEVALTLSAPVCGLGEAVGLPFWFSQVPPRPLLITNWDGTRVPDVGLGVADGVLFS